MSCQGLLSYIQTLAGRAENCTLKGDTDATPSTTRNLLAAKHGAHDATRETPVNVGQLQNWPMAMFSCHRARRASVKTSPMSEGLRTFLDLL